MADQYQNFKNFFQFTGLFTFITTLEEFLQDRIVVFRCQNNHITELTNGTFINKQSKVDPKPQLFHSGWIKKWTFRIAAAIFLFTLTGCATTSQFSDRTLLAFLENGTTTKERVFLKLGQPSGTFNGERIVTYKLGGDSEKGFFVLDRVTGWTEAKYNLVLIFDENNLLSNFSLVQVR